MAKLVWKENSSNWNQGESLFLGKIKVGSAHFDATQPKAGNSFAALCSLPGIKPHLGHYPNLAEAKGLVERAVDSWIKEAGLGA